MDTGLVGERRGWLWFLPCGMVQTLAGRIVGPLTEGCRMSILRNANSHVSCHLILPLSPVEFKKCQCPMSLYHLSLYRSDDKGHVALLNLRNGHVALSILGV